MKPQHDRHLSIILFLSILLLITAFFTNQAFFDWAFTRHQNTASWVARPILLFPFCYCAWHRSLAGIMASIFALLTSMFWFPAPDTPRDDVLRFLAMERDLLSQGWSAQNIAGLMAVLAYGWALAAAFWKRSWIWGLAVAAAGALGKSLWSLLFSPEAGLSVLPFALGGLTVLVLAVCVFRRF